MYSLTEDIVALATPVGQSALAVVRVSGQSVGVLYKKLTKKNSLPKPNFCFPIYIYGSLNRNSPFDRAIITYFKAPKSFTGEDMLEISTHGGNVISKALIVSLIGWGARQALPGEFSYRAFVNNKIDLIQAEGIASLIGASSNIDSFYSLNNVQGKLSKVLLKAREDLFVLICELEHCLDFEEEELTAGDLSGLEQGLSVSLNNLKALLKGCFCVEEAVSDIRIVITGRTNVGKSSLFNQIIGSSRAIVSSVRGTTRDAIETQINLDGIRASLVDTAGIRKSKNNIEIIGIQKTFEEIKRAHVVVLVDDKNPNQVYRLLRGYLENKKTILVKNKVDLKKKYKLKKAYINTSCKNSLGINKLLTELSTVSLKNIDTIYSTYSYSINIRQQSLINKLINELKGSLLALKNTQDIVVCLSCLYKTIAVFDALVLPKDKDAVLNKIFKGFCVGK